MKALAIVMVAAGVAQAEPNAYVQADLLVGAADPLDSAAAMAAIEQGAHVTGRLWEHAELVYGSSHQCLIFQNESCVAHFTQARVGLEARRCTQPGGACGVLGIDLGAHDGRSTFDGMPDHSDRALIAVPRVALDVGNADARLRIGVEIAEALAGRFQNHLIEGALVLGTAYQW